MFSEFDERTQANMEVALHRATNDLPADQAESHEARRFIAEWLIDAARGGHTGLVELTAVARRAAIALRAKR